MNFDLDQLSEFMTSEEIDEFREEIDALRDYIHERQEIVGHATHTLNAIMFMSDIIDEAFGERLN